MNAIHGYDFTLRCDDSFTHVDVKDFLKANCKKWVFQLEKSDTGYLHYQGRVSLIKKRRYNEVINILKFNSIHWSPTLSDTYKTSDFSYVLKEDTKVEGPWADTDEEIYIPRQIREFMTYEMFPWQRDVITWSEVWDKRTIHVIYDPRGCSGKSNLRMYLGCQGKARTIAVSNDYKDIMRNVMDMPISRCYFIDIPRAKDNLKMREFWAAIETVKDGYAFDDRYHFKEKYFDSPNIFVIMNSLPEVSLMSTDRWKFWEITEEKAFKNLNIS